MLVDKVFVVGCGRTGTHWVAGAVSSFEGVGGTPSDMLGVPSDRGEPLWEVRKICEKLAYTPDRVGKKEVARLHALYQHLHKTTADGGCYVDKTHGFLWGAELLAELFPGAVFVGTTRDVFPTVASLIHREGSMKARRAGNRWRAYPLPCVPSGISRRVAHECYSGLCIEERAALVWLAHECKLHRLKKVLGDRLLVVKFEETMDDPASAVEAIGRHIGAEGPGRIVSPIEGVNEKWQTEIPADHTRTRVARVVISQYYAGEVDSNAQWHEARVREVLG